MNDADASRDHSRRASRSAAADPRHAQQISALQAITAERRRLGQRERAAIDRARQSGLTWAQIATALGMHHRQGAQQLHRRLRNDSDLARHGILQAPPASTAQPENRAENPERAAERAVDVARWARAQLVSLDPHKPRTGLLHDLDTATLAMRRCLADLQHRGDIADKRNRDKDGNERPAWQHRLPTGWETDALDCASKLRGIADHASELAHMHAQAVSDHNAASQAHTRCTSHVPTDNDLLYAQAPQKHPTLTPR